MKNRFGIDFHILLTLLQRGWSIISGAVMVLFVPLWLSQTEQGYYYAFSSLIAIQVFFELGLSFVVIQIVSHEMAHVHVDATGRVIGDMARLDRLSSLIKLLRRWYLAASFLFFGVVSIIGLLFFEQEASVPLATWLGPWLLLVLFTSVTLYFSPILAVIEGSGDVGNVARLRLVQSMIGSVLVWVTLSFGWKLWALPLLAFSGAVCTTYWLRYHGVLIASLSRHVPRDALNSIQWRTEIFPFQWRIALSWISGYFIFHFFTPIVFANQGATEAGRLGMSLAIFNALLTLSMSWINAKAPEFAAHIARGERRQLNEIFTQVTKRSMIFTFCSSLLFLTCAYISGAYFPQITQRLASFPIMLCIAVVATANNFIFAAASYMRAHKEEPMLPVSVVVGALTLGVVYLGSRYGVLLPMLLYTAVTLFVGLPWTYHLFSKYFRRTD